MPDNKIEVEWMATATSMLQAIEKVNRRLDQQEAKLQKTADTAGKAANYAAGSFNKLEQELKQSEQALKNLQIGTSEFAAQKQKVDALRNSLGEAKAQLTGNVVAQSGAAGVVNQFTSAIAGTVGTFVSIGAIVSSLQNDLENLSRKQENARLAEVDFGTALAARTISNLAPEERAAVKPLALNTAEELGLNPGAVVEAIGELRSSGANDILEAATYLKEAATAFPQDLAAAKAIARAALIESSATGNRNAAQVIGGTIAAQSISLTKNPEEFAKAFGSNIASGVSVYGQTPEQAREEAAIFSLLETRGAEVAADAQRSFMTQISKFVPETSKKLKAGGVSKIDDATVKRFIGSSFNDRQQMLESDENLRKQFFDGLQETGRTAIMRRLQPTTNDAQILKTVKSEIGTDAEGADMLRKQQQDASTVAAFAIAQGQREAQKVAAEIRSDSVQKLTAELEQTKAVVDEQTRSGIGGTSQSLLERAGLRVEEFMSGQSRGDVLESNLRDRALNEATPEGRGFAQQQLERIEALKLQMEALNTTNAQGNEILRQMLQKLQPGNPAPVRPREAPLPAAIVP